MNYIDRNETRYVRATDLEHQAGIAIKSLPGQRELVACVDDRCALVRDHFEENGTLYVSLGAIETALNARATLDPASQTAQLAFNAHNASSNVSNGPARVGGLAPDFRLPRLDGSMITLSELRGKRVLINSWASW